MSIYMFVCVEFYVAGYNVSGEIFRIKTSHQAPLGTINRAFSNPEGM